MIIDLISAVLLGLGALFFVASAIGVNRFPDFYTRVHAAGKGDALACLLMVLGFAIYNFNNFQHDPWWLNLLVSGKILLIAAFVFITSPTTTHVLMEAGFESGVKHWEKGDPKEDLS